MAMMLPEVEIPPHWPRSLFQRGIISGVEEDRLDLVHQLAVLLRRRARRDPLGVLAEGVPAPARRRLAREGEDVHQRLLGLPGIDRVPEADDGHAVLAKQLTGVVAEPCVQRPHLTRSS